MRDMWSALQETVKTDPMMDKSQDLKARYHDGGGSPDADLPSWAREDGSDQGHGGSS